MDHYFYDGSSRRHRTDFVNRRAHPDAGFTPATLQLYIVAVCDLSRLLLFQPNT